jgi:hypothetical protein
MELNDKKNLLIVLLSIMCICLLSTLIVTNYSNNGHYNKYDNDPKTNMEKCSKSKFKIKSRCRNSCN